jgi:hypothetical protein
MMYSETQEASYKLLLLSMGLFVAPLLSLSMNKLTPRRMAVMVLVLQMCGVVLEPSSVKMLEWPMNLFVRSPAS